MKKFTIYIIIGVLMLFLASCGKQHQAESVVKDFMEAHLVDPSSLSDVTFRDLDSTTTFRGDSLIQQLRKAAAASGRYQSNASYEAPDGASNKLLFVRVSYRQKGEERSDTYYLNSSLTGVVAVKTN
ncbi:MAG: hypothetical protein IKP33_00950 [Prevotella sp.]|nr:hypothetical protein [Prevotella sp.]